MPSVRVLVVEDHEPIRRFICSILENELDVCVVGLVSDGLAAVQGAQELQPDLILLDIGLPTLNGIEAARRIRKVSPTSKILFVTENRSTDILEEALSTGAGGYVVKSDAGSELLLAIEAVLRGKRFVSPGLNGRNSQSVERHELRLCADDTALVDGLAQSIEAILENRNAIVVVVTESHRASLLEKLRADGVDVNGAAEKKLLSFLNVADWLSTVPVEAPTDGHRSAGMPHVIVEAVQRAKNRHRHITVG
jgi:DNA-binding NarL/FixJ family response regulator